MKRRHIFIPSRVSGGVSGRNPFLSSLEYLTCGRPARSRNTVSSLEMTARDAGLSAGVMR